MQRTHPVCENSNHLAQGIGVARCWYGVAVRKVTVTYNEVESDTFDLCYDCAERLRKDARKHGYQCRSKRMKI